jgi:GDP-L-fucose synthase
MNKAARIYVAGHRGLVGSAIVRRLEQEGYRDLVLRTSAELDLRNQADVARFFASEQPEYVFLAAATVGGIWTNSTYPANFIYDNLMIQTNVIHQSYLCGVKRLLFLGSSCIYPKLCPQPIKEEYLLTGELEPTNEPYAIAKIAGIKMCQAYNEHYGTNYVSVMPSNLYGPYDNFDLETSHVLPAMIRKFHLAKLAIEGDWDAIRQDEAGYGRIPHDVKKSLSSNPPKVLLWGTGAPRREFLHVDDMADACIYVMNLEAIPAAAEPLEAPIPCFVNVGTGIDATIRELAEIIQGVVGFTGERAFDTAKPDGTPRKLLDVSRLAGPGMAVQDSPGTGHPGDLRVVSETSA